MTANDERNLSDLISRADPASSLEPLRADQVHQLTEQTMSPDTPTRPATAPARRRGWLIAGLSALSAGTAAAIIIPLALGGTNGNTTIRQPQAGGPAAMCAIVTPDSIAAATTAFRATVISITGDTVTLQVEDRFVGDVSNPLTTTQGVSTGVDGEPVTFIDGNTYLIATGEGRTILTCGASGPDSPELDTLYQQAFPR